ncbi:Ribosomal RNA small subunit methyltransferase E [subsurface metagenome]
MAGHSGPGRGFLKMHRFFIPPQWIDHDRVVIKGKQVHQLRNVLRMAKGDRILVLDNSGWQYEVELRSVEREQVEGVVREKSLSLAEPRVKIVLYQALLKGEKFEFVLQKGTELGIASFVPMVSERCLVGLEHVIARRLNRWQRIIAEAGEQSGRGKLPALGPVMPFEQACHSAQGFSLLAWEGEKALGLRAALQGQEAKDIPSVNLFIGPEGGFSPAEGEFARGCGVVPITLGRRVLRAETAGLVATAAILYHYGDLDLT